MTDEFEAEGVTEDEWNSWRQIRTRPTVINTAWSLDGYMSNDALDKTPATKATPSRPPTLLYVCALCRHKARIWREYTSTGSTEK